MSDEHILSQPFDEKLLQALTSPSEKDWFKYRLGDESPSVGEILGFTATGRFKRAREERAHLFGLLGEHTIKQLGQPTLGSLYAPGSPGQSGNLQDLIGMIRGPQAQGGPSSPGLDVGAPPLTSNIQPPNAGQMLMMPTAAQPARLGGVPISDPAAELMKNPALSGMRIDPAHALALLNAPQLYTDEQIRNPMTPLPASIQERKIEAAAKREEGKGPLAQLHNQRVQLEAKVQANSNDVVAARDLGDVNANIQKVTTITDQSPFSNVQADPLNPGKFVGMDKKTGQMMSIPSKVVGGMSIPSGATGDELIKSLPASIANIVKAMTEGRIEFPSSFALKSPYWQNLISLAGQYEPGFDAIAFKTRLATRKDFTSGPESKSLNALNTVMGHYDNLGRNLQALDNSGFVGWNWLKNTAAGSMFSTDPARKAILNRVETDLQAVASEMERAYRGTGGNLEDIKQWKKNFNAADTPQAQQASVQEGLSLLESKINALGNKYNQGMGTTREGITLLSPKAQLTFQRLSGHVPTPTANPSDILSQADAILKGK